MDCVSLGEELMSVNVNDLKLKLELISKDIDRLNQESGHSQKVEMLYEYQKYILDEIKELEEKSRTS